MGTRCRSFWSVSRRGPGKGSRKSWRPVSKVYDHLGTAVSTRTVNFRTCVAGGGLHISSRTRRWPLVRLLGMARPDYVLSRYLFVVIFSDFPTRWT
jgi:hypothetical protein